MARNMGIHFAYKGSAHNAIEKWTQALEKQLKEYEGDLVEKLEKVLNVVERVSQERIPKDTLAAHDSFYREVVKEGNKIIARAGYDRPGLLPYIVYIHEFEPINGFKTHGTTVRFLSEGFQQASQQIDQILGSDK
jgi:hypothetical protein